MGHAYYEFQHVELANVGSGKKRSKNPPGGPTSNIFAAEEVTPARSSNRPNKMASSIPFGDTVDSPPSSTSSSPPPTPVKTAEAIPLHAGDPSTATFPDPALAGVLTAISRKASPNPINGQGYEPAEPAKKPSPQPSTPRRRIPPGGFSSPLW